MVRTADAIPHAEALLAASADPEASSLALERIADSFPSAVGRLEAEPALLEALVAVTAASPWLTRVCATDPMAMDVLAGSAAPWPGEVSSPDELRRARELGILRTAALDLRGARGFESVCADLSDLATRLLEAAWDATASSSGGLAVIAMGKLGAAELNYASDVDILLVTAGAPVDPVPYLAMARNAWRVDLDLRPEGRAGPLSRTIESYVTYWSRWAEPWEFQALLKARPVAGDEEVGRRFQAAAYEQVWGRPLGADELRRVRQLKARSEAEVSRRGLADREIKRGMGGIRDIEFALQLLQLVHGGADPALRVRSTSDAARALVTGGYVDADDADSLEEAYRFLRTVEHRLQLFEGQQAYSLPAGGPRLTHLARVLGYRPDGSRTEVAQFEADLRRHRSVVRSIHQRLYFRPLLELFSLRRGPGGLTEEAAAARLSAFGFADAERTRQAVVELTRGLSRASQLMQQMLPLLLDWLSAAADPDQGLLGLRRIAGEPLARDQLVAVCRESPVGARDLCQLLGTGPFFTRELQRHPDALGGLASGRFPEPRPEPELRRLLEGSLAWRSGEDAVQTGLRLFASAERLRIAARDVLEIDDQRAVGEALSDLADCAIAAAVRHADPQVPLAVIGMGRLGGRELSYGSDLDLLVTYDAGEGDPRPGSTADAESAAASIVRILAGSTPATGLYRVDLALRPEGRQGPAARSLEAYSAYYSRWARQWERQALLRGRFVAGDERVGERFAALAQDFLWGRPFGPGDAVEIRRTKARVERERVPAGEDPKFHLKLGPGSISDVEWTVQLLQLQHRVVASGTVEALGALCDEGVLSSDDAAVLLEAYQFCDRARNRLALVRGVPSDSLPGTGAALTTLARSLGFTASGVRNEYARVTRRCRRVVERLFYANTAG